MGRGLSALLDEPAAEVSSRDASIAQHARPMSGINMLPVVHIEANPFQPRIHFGEEALSELAQSISELR